MVILLNLLLLTIPLLCPPAELPPRPSSPHSSGQQPFRQQPFGQQPAAGQAGKANPAVKKNQTVKDQEPRQEETLAIETNLVVVNVTIRDQKHQFVPNLTLRNFRILEEEVEQKILSFDYEENPFAGAILLDASGSMESRLSLVRAACAIFVDRLREGDSYSIFSFGDAKVKLLQDFTEIRDIPDAVWDLRARGTTTLYDAIVTAAEALARRAERRRAILVVSDGADNQSRASLDEAIRRAVEAQLVVYAVDMSESGPGSPHGGAAALRALATRTGGRFFTSPGGNRLREAFAETIDELHHQYTLTYSSSLDDAASGRRDGRWRTIEVRIDRPGLDIRTRQGYWARKH
ncbi:MAG: VWA domain-containing protein [Acidobacteriota bacterium]